MSDDERIVIPGTVDWEAARAERAEAERDTLRGLLKKARPYVYGKTITDRELEEEIDAALNKGGGE